jgi:septal ring factor EnvC (AmiA/AmiB activator)
MALKKALKTKAMFEKIGYTLLLLVIGGIVSYLLFVEPVKEKINDYDNQIIRYEDKLSDSKNKYSKLKNEYDNIKQRLTKGIDSLTSKIDQKEKEISDLDVYYAQLSNDSSIKELERNLDTTLKIDKQRGITFLPILKTQEINYTYSYSRELNQKNVLQTDLIEKMDSVIVHDSVFIFEQSNTILDLYSVNDSILGMSKSMNKHIKEQAEDVDKLKKQRKFLIGGIILETILLILIGVN